MGPAAARRDLAGDRADSIRIAFYRITNLYSRDKPGNGSHAIYL